MCFSQPVRFPRRQHCPQAWVKGERKSASLPSLSLDFLNTESLSDQKKSAGGRPQARVRKPYGAVSAKVIKDLPPTALCHNLSRWNRNNHTRKSCLLEARLGLRRGGQVALSLAAAGLRRKLVAAGEAATCPAKRDTLITLTLHSVTHPRRLCAAAPASTSQTFYTNSGQHFDRAFLAMRLRLHLQSQEVIT